MPISDQEVEFLCSDRVQSRIRPYKGPVFGKRVRSAPGAMAGVGGVLVRQKSGLRFVLPVALIFDQAHIVCNIS